MGLRTVGAASPAHDLSAMALAAFDVLPWPALLLDDTGALLRGNRAAAAKLPNVEPGMSADQLVAALARQPDELARVQAEFRAILCSEGGTCSLPAVSEDLDLSAVPVEQGWLLILSPPMSEGGAAQARFDALTGLPNRAHFYERLSVAATHARRSGTPFALMFLDLDRFKQVNDTLGHPVGDALLVKVAERMRSALRGDDVIGRLGGDEFAVLTQASDPRLIGALGTRLIDLVSRPYLVNGHMLNVGTSIGLALMPDDADDTEALAKCADLALYRAKADGRGVMRRYEAEMAQKVEERRSLEFDLRKALALGEFELFYQPQFDIDAERAIGFEALLRWRHPQRGLVPPAGFLPLAEETGLIVPIGEWVLRTACAAAATWPEEVTVAVNLSAVQFRSGKLAQTVISTLAATGLAAHRLELEITESVLLEDDDANRAALLQLHELGVRISVDDFGTGYSSLAYLRSFPFDKIKIDQAFVREMAQDPDSEAIVRAVVELGATLGMTTIAEGVECPDELRRIRSHGCTNVQGFLLGRPIPLDEVMASLDGSRREHGADQLQSRSGQG